MIEVEHVTKDYGATRAVNDVSFTVRPGEVVGFLGPNGAGKSTVLKMLSTWLRPTAGHVRVAGHDTVAEPLAVRRKIGYLPEHNPLYDTMGVTEFLDFVGHMHGLAGALLAERRAWVVERCRLADVLAKRIHQCSKGYRQRVGVAAALIHDPPVILLDEPTHGLDPLQVEAFLAFVRSLAAEHAVLFSSHVLSEVVTVSDRLLAIQGGRLLLDATLEELRATAAREGRPLEAVLLDAIRREAAPATGEPAP